MIDQGGVGGSGADVVAVDPAALRRTAKGLTEILGELTKLGAVESADLGGNFDQVGLTAMQLGSSGASKALDSFDYRWKWEVRTLFQQGSDLADGLGMAAGATYDNDQYVKGTFKDLAVDGFGDPDQSADQTQKQSLAASFDRLGAPDESRDQLKQHVTATAKAEMADEVRSNPYFSIVDRLDGGKLSDATADWDPNHESSLHTMPGAEGGAK